MPAPSLPAPEPADRLIVALDLPTLDEAEAMVARLGPSVTFYKIGYELAFAGGLALAERLIGQGKQVFIDLKLHDIGNTVAAGVRAIARSGATFLTVHAYPQTMRAAVEGRGDSGLRLLAVTALTSYDDADLKDAGYSLAVRDLVRVRAAQARDIGIDGIVCSAAETGIVREIAGPSMVIVTPGIRPAGSTSGDQKRVLTPGEALRAGVDYLVVGRPVVKAVDPRAAADAIVAEIAGAIAAGNMDGGAASS
jgi:orotidine-5'-phosphate decarboxylase